MKYIINGVLPFSSEVIPLRTGKKVPGSLPGSPLGFSPLENSVEYIDWDFVCVCGGGGTLYPRSPLCYI